MANSFQDFTGDGTTTVFSFSIGYIDRAHISAQVDAADTPFSWISSNAISITPAPANGAGVRILRTTPGDAVVDFQDGQVLTEADLDTVNLQALYVSQEAADNLGTTIVADAVDGNYDFNNRRLKNVATPVNADDAVTKDWAESSGSSFVSAAAAEAGDAAVHAAAASASAVAAQASEDEALVHRSGAYQSQLYCETLRDACETAEAGASAAATTAANQVLQNAYAARTWYDRTSVRSDSVVYQNVTNLDREIKIRGYNNAVNVRNLDISSDGVTWFTVDGLIGGSVGSDTASVTVAPGEYYRMNLTNVTSLSWYERD